MVTYRLDFWWQRSRGSWRRLCWFLDAAHLEVLVEVGAVLQALWTKSTCVTVYSSFSDPLQEPEPKLVHKKIVCNGGVYITIIAQSDILNVTS